MKQTAIKFGKIGLVILAIPVVLFLMVLTVSAHHNPGHTQGPPVSNPTEEKPSICHPVYGKGETGNGWNIISPDKASAHIDENVYPNAGYWKHETLDGRVDTYATADGKCPDREGPECPDGFYAPAKGKEGDPECAPNPKECPAGTTIAGYKDEQLQEPICKGEPTGCPYGDSIPVDSPKCVPPSDVENTTPTPVKEDETEVFSGK